MASKRKKTLWGHDFPVVRDGLSENEVVSFVEELIANSDEGLQKLAHIDSLYKLANRTLDEANKLAEQCQEDAKRSTEEQRVAILEKAREDALAITNETQETSRVRAEKQSQKIIKAAESKAGALQDDLRKTVEEWVEQVEQALGNLNESVRPLIAVWRIDQFDELTAEVETLVSAKPFDGEETPEIAPKPTRTR